MAFKFLYFSVYRLPCCKMGSKCMGVYTHWARSGETVYVYWGHGEKVYVYWGHGETVYVYWGHGETVYVYLGIG